MFIELELVRKNGISMVQNYNYLSGLVNNKTRILALEHSWIRAFTNAKYNNVFGFMTLPPFLDTNGKTEKFLEELDMIWVSDWWATEHTAIATQDYLRYLLHVEPFIKKVSNEGWEMKEIQGYGKIYLKNKV